MRFVSSIYQDPQNICLWRLALSTIVRTLLAFTLPYLVSYYCVIGAWQGIRMLLLWMDLHATP
jgi:hypothetical protein